MFDQWRMPDQRSQLGPLELALENRALQISAAETAIDIGALKVGFVHVVGDLGYSVSAPYEPFMSSGDPDLKVAICHGSLPSFSRSCICGQSANWTSYRSDDTVTIAFHGLGEPPYQAVTLDLRNSVGTVLFSADWLLAYQTQYKLTHYPLVEMIYMHLLAANRGVLLHSFGAKANQHGIAFVGKSGAGKSTMARLFLESGRGEVLCDDRVIIRSGSSGFRMYGTPWHGDIPATSPASVPLKNVYFLRHGANNRLTPLAPAEAVSRLMSCVFTALWDAPGMAFTLRFLEQLVREVPCFELGFIPEPATVDFVLSQP